MADYCFPEGLSVSKISADDPVVSNVLFQSMLYIKESLFVFTLPAASDCDDNCLYGLCLTFTDLQVVGNELYRVERGLCLITVNQQYFKLLEEVLSQLLNTIKDARKEQYFARADSKIEFSAEVDSILAIRVEDIIKSDLLKLVYSQRVNPSCFALNKFDFFTFTQPTIFYEYDWHCAVLFSLGP